MFYCGLTVMLSVSLQTTRSARTGTVQRMDLLIEIIIIFSSNFLNINVRTRLALY